MTWTTRITHNARWCSTTHKFNNFYNWSSNWVSVLRLKLTAQLNYWNLNVHTLRQPDSLAPAPYVILVTKVIKTEIIVLWYVENGVYLLLYQFQLDCFRKLLLLDCWLRLFVGTTITAVCLPYAFVFDGVSAGIGFNFVSSTRLSILFHRWGVDVTIRRWGVDG